jgi:hypothetical protein
MDFPDQVRAYYQNTSFLSDLELQFEELFARLFYLGPLRDYPRRQYSWAGAQPADMGRRGERVVDALLASRESGEKPSRGKGKKRQTLEERVAEWLEELGLIHSFQVRPVTEGGRLFQVWVPHRRGGADARGCGPLLLLYGERRIAPDAAGPGPVRQHHQLAGRFLWR